MQGDLGLDHPVFQTFLEGPGLCIIIWKAGDCLCWAFVLPEILTGGSYPEVLPIDIM
jgi:hypothetical protein